MAERGPEQDDRIVRDEAGGFWQRRPGGYGAAAAVAAIGLVAAGAVQYSGLTLGKVQDDLAGRSIAALEQAGYQGLSVSVTGRDVTVRGQADPAAVPQILSLVTSQTGVRVAIDELNGGTGSGTASGTPSATATGATPTTTASATPTATATATPTPTDSSAAPTGTATATASASPTASTPAPTPTPSASTPNPTASSTGDSADAAAAAAAIGALPKIQFPTALSGPTTDGRRTVAKIAAILQQYPSVRAQVQGHTDDLGTARVNLELSASRAEVVRALLIRAGISGSRLTAQGYGESRPFVPNTSDANRATNRRVSFVLR